MFIKCWTYFRLLTLYLGSTSWRNLLDEVWTSLERKGLFPESTRYPFYIKVLVFKAVLSKTGPPISFNWSVENLWVQIMYYFDSMCCSKLTPKYLQNTFMVRRKNLIIHEAKKFGKFWSKVYIWKCCHLSLKKFHYKNRTLSSQRD